MSRTYDPSKVSVIYGGKPITGLVKDTFISIEPQGEGQRVSKGIKDESGWSIDADSSEEVTLTLMQTSLDNDYLSNRFQAQRNGVEGDRTLIIKDLNGTSLFESHEARVANLPTDERGTEAGSNDWVIRCASAVRHTGGNVKTSL